MDVEIFSDVVCPWCAIGKRRFEAALSRFEHADEVTVTWRAFELDPDAPSSSDVDAATHLAEKYGISREQAIANQQRLSDLAAAEGWTFRFDLAQRGNSFDAHRLLHFAGEVGLQDELKERLFLAYFTEGSSIAEHDSLVAIASSVGLDAEKCAEILDSDRYAEEVRIEERTAHDLGIGGVPFFVIDRQYGISGAQSADVILSVLNEVWSKNHPLTMTAGPDGGLCEDDSCAI